MRGAVIIVGGQEARNPRDYATRIGPTRASGVASASSWMMQPKPKGALSSAKQNHPTRESDAFANWAKIQLRVRYRFIFIPQTKGGTTGVGFLLRLYRITFVRQDFPSPPTCLDLPRLA